ncbi:multicopper oxidase family protein [Francisella sp. Scap27]|uniref:multicopper oxidase family protein n=1 Tax=Francisella sp. Scap27 TaxID=2589986 RepID=UPI0015B85D11|nr:multicopper oxidase family protein [Francisella sp. Scap27]QLE79832.1 multicopper oxidase family protein [Francisella sp. Scap27]
MKNKKTISSILLLLMVFISVYIYYSENTVVELLVTNKTIDINGKETTVNTVIQPDGTWGYYGTVGDDFNVKVKNGLKKPTVLHWHGLLLPNKYDGTELNQPYIKPNSSYSYDFKLIHSGTFWMHSHYGFQEQNFVEAPFIVYPRGYDATNDVVVMFQGFSFKQPEAIMKDLKHSDDSNMHMHGTHKMAMVMDKDAKPDLNDVSYDAFLTNYRTAKSPEIKHVVAGQIYRLRFLNGSSSTNFWINLGKLKGTAIAVDGQNIKPFEGNKFQLAIAQRMDIQVQIPKNGVFPIVGQVEGEKYQTGIVLTTINDKNLTIPAEAKVDSKPFNYAQLKKLHSAKDSLALGSIEKTIDLKLTGNMKDYVWQINGQTWPDVSPIELKFDKTYEFKIQNETGMSHPIHIHGHVFKVVKVNGKSIDDGVIRDTVYVEPKSSITIAMKANAKGKWFIHCHMLYHMHSGMMTFIETKSA